MDERRAGGACPGQNHGCCACSALDSSEPYRASSPRERASEKREGRGGGGTQPSRQSDESRCDRRRSSVKTQLQIGTGKNPQVP